MANLRYALLLLVLLPLVGYTQQDPLAGFASKYRHYDNCEHINLGGLALTLGRIVVRDIDIRRVLGTINHLRVIEIDGAEVVPDTDLARLRQDAYDRGFDDYLEVRSDGQHIRILAYERKNALRGLLLIIHDEQDNTLTAVSALGRLTYQQLTDSGLLDEL